MPAFAKNRTPSTDTKKPSKAAFFKVQAKLKMGQSGDKYEQEADSVAQQVVKNSNGNSVVRDLHQQWDWEGKNFPGYGQMVTRGIRGTGLDTFRRW